MRKGWFKKARKKFVKKRVYRWKLCFENSSEEIEFLNGWAGGSYTLKFHSHDFICQLLEKVRDFGFIEGFWYARKEGKKKEGFNFWFDKRI